MFIKKLWYEGVNGFICQRKETGARLLETRELTFGYHKNWQNYCLAEKMHHTSERILTYRGTYWHTYILTIEDTLDHSVTIHFIIYWVTFANLLNSLFYYMSIYLFMLVFYSILDMLICFRTLQERLKLNIPLISACLQDQECPRSMCQPITVSIATTPAVFANAQ